MYITKEIYNKIVFNTPNPPPETGGALFQRNNIILQCVFDNGLCEYGKYTPNVNILNREIKYFAEIGYEFCGIFHSHFPFGENLSDDDKKYIENITVKLGGVIDKLYFPIVLPNVKIVPYCSYIKGGNVIILDDKLFII